MPREPIETERLTLRRFEEHDLEPLWEIHGNRDAMRFTFSPETREDSARNLRAYAALYDELGYAPWTVMHGGRVIGWGGLNVDPFQPGFGPEVSYFLAPDTWGRGFATEVARAALRHGFEDHALDRICAFTRPDNTASARVLQKCGFEKQRYIADLERDYYEIDRPSWERANLGN